jgi:hypothetical protein
MAAIPCYIASAWMAQKTLSTTAFLFLHDVIAVTEGLFNAPSHSNDCHSTAL